LEAGTLPGQLRHATNGECNEITNVVAEYDAFLAINRTRGLLNSGVLQSEPVLDLSPAAVVIIVGQVAREFVLGNGAPIPGKIEERKPGRADQAHGVPPTSRRLCQEKALVGLLVPPDVDRLRLATIAARQPRS
jgi:hypothetical protein